MNVLKAMKLNHFTTADVHTEYQGKFAPTCNARKIGGYVVPDNGKTQVTCPNCLKIKA